VPKAIQHTAEHHIITHRTYCILLLLLVLVLQVCYFR
jgi:hypothetical protein